MLQWLQSPFSQTLEDHEEADEQGLYLVWSATIQILFFLSFFSPVLSIAPLCMEPQGTSVCKGPPHVLVGVQMTMSTLCHNIACTATLQPQEDDKDDGYRGHHNADMPPLCMQTLWLGLHCIVSSLCWWSVPADGGIVVCWGWGGAQLCRHHDWGLTQLVLVECSSSSGIVVGIMIGIACGLPVSGSVGVVMLESGFSPETAIPNQPN